MKLHFRSILALEAVSLATAALVALAAGCGHQTIASPGSASSRAARPIVSEASPVAGDAPTEPAALAQPATSGESAALNSEPTVPTVAPAPTADPAAVQPASASAEPVAATSEAPKETKPMPKRPPPDRAPTKPGDAEKITFDDLDLRMPADVVFRPFMLSDRVKELDGQRISIMGYIHGAPESTRNIKEFILLKNTECKYGPAGQADHLAAIFMRKDERATYVSEAIKVEGTLRVEPVTGTDGNTWSVFRLDDAIIK